MCFKQVALKIHFVPLSLKSVPCPHLQLQHPWVNRRVNSYVALLFSLMSAALIPTDCPPWVCRPFFECILLCFFQKSFCSWSSSDTRARPISRCIFRFSSHSFRVEKSGLKEQKRSPLKKTWKSLTLVLGKKVYSRERSDRLSASRSQHRAAIGKKAGGQSGGQ